MTDGGPAPFGRGHDFLGSNLTASAFQASWRPAVLPGPSGGRSNPQKMVCGNGQMPMLSDAPITPMHRKDPPRRPLEEGLPCLSPRLSAKHG